MLLLLSVGLVRSNSAFAGVVDLQGTLLVDPTLGVAFTFEAASVLFNRPSEFSLVSQEEVA